MMVICLFICLFVCFIGGLGEQIYVIELNGKQCGIELLENLSQPASQQVKVMKLDVGDLCRINKNF